MVRPAPARAHPSSHRSPPARRDRAGRRARFPALPVRLAARVARRRAWKGRTRCPNVWRRWKASRRPARAWETEILPARLEGYQPSWLDAQCLAGRIAWARLTPRCRRRRSARGHVSPVARDADRAARPAPQARYGWRSRRAGRAGPRRPRAQAVLECARRRTARCSSTNWPRPRACCARRSRRRSANSSALGLVTSDSFGGLRALLAPSSQRKPLGGVKRRGRVLPSTSRAAAAGRSCAAAAPTRDAERRGRGGRACRAHAARAATAWCSGASRRARRLAAAVARSRCASTAGSKRGARFAAADSSPGSRASNSRCPKRSAALREIRRRARRRPMGVAVGRRSAQSRRHPDAGRTARGADRQPRRLSRRPAGRLARGARRRNRSGPRRVRTVGGRAPSHALVGVGADRGARVRRTGESVWQSHRAGASAENALAHASVAALALSESSPAIRRGLPDAPDPRAWDAARSFAQETQHFLAYRTYAS